jgi:hypothetical protein
MLGTAGSQKIQVVRTVLVFLESFLKVSFQGILVQERFGKVQSARKSEMSGDLLIEIHDVRGPDFL